MFAITRPGSSTTNAITRYSNTTGDVKDSKILIEDVTNTRDTSKKANVLSIPAEGGKKMVYGYCTDQVDGTSFIGGVFDANATEFPYASGLAIGGTSGNLLWKGKQVATTDMIPTVPSYGTSATAVSTTASAGSASTLSRSDHVHSITKATVVAALGYTPPTTDTNTHYTTGITAGASGTISNSALTNPYIKIKDDSTHRSQIQIKGGGATTVSSDANGVITISSTDTNTQLSFGSISAIPTNATTANGSATTAARSDHKHGFTKPASGDWWNDGICTVGTDGVTKVGKYIDFHNTDASTKAFDVRLYTDGANQNTILLPNHSGRIPALKTDAVLGSATRPVYVSASGEIIACTGLQEVLGASATALTLTSNQFGTALPTAGTVGRLFFKKA